MKTLLIRVIAFTVAWTISFALITAAFGSDMLQYMRDGKITVTLKGGKSYEFSTNEYMVVRRDQHKDVVIEVDSEGQRTVHQSPAMVVSGPNTVRVLGGVGPKDIKVTTGATSVDIEQDYSLVYGLGYSRQLNNRLSLEAVGLSNKTGVLGLGVSF